MINYNYVIERNSGPGKSTTFVPETIPTHLNNVVLIEGPNSSAKSTLLNLIALGLFGLKSPRINLLLKNKIDTFLDLEHQKITFSFDVTSKNQDVVLRSEKNCFDNQEFVVQEHVKGKTPTTLSFESFERKYNLIYDIPSNPTQRLPELLTELKDEQFKFGNHFKDFGFYLHKLVGEISSSRNPKRIKTLSNKLSEANLKLEKLDREIIEVTAFLKQLEMNAYIDYYYQYTNEANWLNQKRISIQQEIERAEYHERKITRRISKNQKKLEGLKGDFRHKYKKITPLLSKHLPRSEKNRFSIWKEIDPYCIKQKDIKNIIEDSVYFVEIVGKEIESLEKKQEFKDAKLIENLLDALIIFEDSSLLLPELEVTLEDIIQSLKKQSEEGYVLIQKHKVLQGLVNELNQIKKLVENLQFIEESLGDEPEVCEEIIEKSPDDSEKKQQLTEINANLKIISAKSKAYYQNCISKGIDSKLLERPYKEVFNQFPRNEEVKKYLALGEEQVLSEIKGLTTRLAAKKDDKIGLKTVIKMHQTEYDNLVNKKPHKFENDLEQINNLLRNVETITAKILKKFDLNLGKLKNKEINRNQKLNKPELNYYSEVSKYLASRIGSFRHIKKIYVAKEVDLISGKIFTENQEVIYISDMGTGQSQSAYILGLLNAKNDDRKIIALFDEIAMMDEESLKPIFSRLKELYESNQLLLGILVQRNDKLNIRELV